MLYNDNKPLSRYNYITGLTETRQPYDLPFKSLDPVYQPIKIIDYNPISSMPRFTVDPVYDKWGWNNYMAPPMVMPLPPCFGPFF